MTKALTIEDIGFLAFTLAKERMSWNEPIPDFSTRYPHKLESCILTPFQTFGKKQLYKSLIDKASILFYLLIKNHPFQNGNKRIAVTTLLVFLFNNKKWLKLSNQELYNFAVWVAQSPSKLKDETVAAITSFIKKQMIDLRKK